eukprot:9524810-Prorocentrum_lima.AAC.1
MKRSSSSRTSAKISPRAARRASATSTSPRPPSCSAGASPLPSVHASTPTRALESSSRDPTFTP